jgi:ADP-ribosylglycohydrolase
MLGNMSDNSRYSLTIGIILLLLAAFVTAGCGGSGESSEITVPAGSLSKAEFVRKADAICEATRSRFAREYTALVQKYQQQGGSSQAELKVVTDAIVKAALLPNYEKGIDEIVALGAPKGDEDEVAAFLNALRERLDEIEATPTKLASTITPFARVEKKAEAYGLTGCAESFS